MDTPQTPVQSADASRLTKPVQETGEQPDRAAAAAGVATDSSVTSETAPGESVSPELSTDQAPELSGEAEAGKNDMAASNPDEDVSTSKRTGTESHEDPAKMEAVEASETTAEGDDELTSDATPFDPEVFDDALNRVLSSAGGEVLFRITGDQAEGDKVAAVRLGEGEARLIALVILPPNGAPLRVEPVEDSANPLAPLAKSYASLVDAWKAAA